MRYLERILAEGLWNVVWGKWLLIQEGYCSDMLSLIYILSYWNMLAVRSSQLFAINSVILWSIINQAQLPKMMGSREMKTSRNRNLHAKDVGKNNGQETWDRQTACLGFVRNNLFKKHFKNIRPKDPIAFSVSFLHGFLWVSSFMAVLVFLLVLTDSFSALY